ncbi:MAG: hypothetical protein ACLTKQ_08600 [Acutalibacteraceae bacterium]
MAILNDMGQQVSFECTDLIQDVREDILHLRRAKKSKRCLQGKGRGQDCV